LFCEDNKEETAMAWRGIVGKSFAPDQFEEYVTSLTFGAWRPRFVVVHNTSSPDRKTWDGWQARRPPVTDEKWGRNLEDFYKGQGWSGCPHLFVTPSSILVMNPLTRSGTHTPSWNTISWGVETVGEFDRDPFTGSIKDNLVAALAILHATAGLRLLPYERGVGGLHFHKEDRATTHKHCPGKKIVKADLIKAVQAEIQRRNPGEHPADEGANIGVVKTSPDDPLNLREKPSGRASIVGKLNDGDKVTVLGGKDVGSSRWLNVSAADKSGWVAARYVDIT
jgi:Bacterial SH3 domain/N-acetylmuramoyl-L-alanine amidase